MPDRKEPSTEVVHPLTGEVMPTPPEWMQGLPIVLNSDDITEDSFARILNASTPEEAFFNPETDGLRDLSGQTITVLSVDGLQPSTIRDHEDEYYLRLTAQTSKGVQSLSTGQTFAARQLIKGHFEGWYPRRLRVVELQSSKDPSRTSLWVVDAGPAVGGDDVDQPF